MCFVSSCCDYSCFIVGPFALPQMHMHKFALAYLVCMNLFGQSFENQKVGPRNVLENKLAYPTYLRLEFAAHEFVVRKGRMASYHCCTQLKITHGGNHAPA